MTNPMITIHDVSTGEIIEREMNDAEFADYKDLTEKAIIQKKAEQAKEAAKQSAQAKLAALGLTTTDLEALGL